MYKRRQVNNIKKVITKLSKNPCHKTAVKMDLLRTFHFMSSSYLTECVHKVGIN